MTGAMGGDNAVPFSVPARFMTVGALSLAAFWTGLALRPELLLAHPAVPGVLAIVHVFTLGFGASVLIGALHQLVPVLLITRLCAPGWGAATWATSSAGSLAIVIGFATGSRPAWLAIGGTLVLIGATILLVNLVATVRTARRVDAVAGAVLASAAALWGTVALGAAIALGRIVPWVAMALGPVRPLHLTLGLIGAFVLAIAGAGHKLLSMFVLSHGASDRPLRWVSGAVGAAVLLAAIGAWTPGSWRATSFAGAGGTDWLARGVTVALGVALAALIIDVRAILTRRMRKRTDVGVTTFLIGVLMFVPAWTLLAFGRPADAIALLLTGGLALAIGGMMVKIVGFLAWQHRYAPLVGRDPSRTTTIPMLADMTVPALGWITAGCLLAASLLLAGVRLAHGDAAAPPPPELLGLARLAATVGSIGGWSLVAHLAWIVAGRHRPRTAQTRADDLVTPAAPPGWKGHRA
ncbi:MAG: hypothetical protein U5J97_02710 [Trueperaceae bacterium]|nr:hypothetical protein [Trueperaceae bacterium]